MRWVNTPNVWYPSSLSTGLIHVATKPQPLLIASIYLPKTFLIPSRRFLDIVSDAVTLRCPPGLAAAPGRKGQEPTAVYRTLIIC